MDQEWRGNGFRIIQEHHIYCTFHFYYYYISFTSDYWALDPKDWGPLIQRIYAVVASCLQLIFKIFFHFSCKSSKYNCLWKMLKCRSNTYRNNIPPLSRIHSFPCGSAAENPFANAEDMGLIPVLERSPWRRKKQCSPVFLPEKSHGKKSLVGYSPWSPWSHRESDMT